jgi:hypothetical protein
VGQKFQRLEESSCGQFIASDHKLCRVLRCDVSGAAEDAVDVFGCIVLLPFEIPLEERCDSSPEASPNVCDRKAVSISFVRSSPDTATSPPEARIQTPSRGSIRVLHYTRNANSLLMASEFWSYKSSKENSTHRGHSVVDTNHRPERCSTEFSRSRVAAIAGTFGKYALSAHGRGFRRAPSANGTWKNSVCPRTRL